MIKKGNTGHVNLCVIGTNDIMRMQEATIIGKKDN
jgi:hypothetical protein